MKEIKVWFISDTHFNHDKIREFCNRPFNSIEQMNEYMIEQWNSVVGKDDKVYHLGDFGFGNKEQIAEIVSRLNGRIYLTKGNHEVRNNQFYRDCGFAEVYDHPIILKEFVVLSHEPMPFTNNYYGPMINIFGHVHTSPMFDTWGHRHVCVCVERHMYKPVEWNEVMKHFE